MEIVKHEIGERLVSDKRDITIIDIKRNYSNNFGLVDHSYKFKCNKCGFDCGEHYRKGEKRDDYWMLKGNIEQGQGCPCCANQVTVTDINSIFKTDKWMIDLGLDEEFAKRNTKSCARTSIAICPICGKKRKVKISDMYRLKTISCNCGDGFTYPEKFINSILTQLNIDFQTEYSPQYLVRYENGKKSRKYSDFYLPKYNLVIEADGRIGHKGGVVHSKTKRTLQELVDVDKWKTEQHKLHGVETIRINCFESDMKYIKENILNSKLNELFDLSIVDWNKCEEYALGNLAKMLWEYWNDNCNNLTINEVAKQFRINKDTVKKYLKKGNNIGKCVFDINIENQKYKNNSTKRNKEMAKPILVVKDDKATPFRSVSDFIEESIEIFGIKFNSTNTYNACSNETKYKGFNFMYIPIDEYYRLIDSNSNKV